MTPWNILRGANGNDDEQDGPAPETPTDLSSEEILESLNAINLRLETMAPLAAKFRQRSKFRDPVTKAPRYGEKTMKRVVDLLDEYETLCHAMDIVHGVKSIEDDNESEKEPLVLELERKIKKQNDELENSRKKREEEQILKQHEEERLKDEAAKQQKRREEEEMLRLQAERAELATRAEIARRERIQNELRAAEMEREAERTFLNSIDVGVEGVKQQLERIRKSCSKADLDIALDALYTLFSQIQSKPEERKFRSVRRDHPKFNEDIGRHEGGKEVLIAAGFTYVEIDGIKCFFSKEPDLASDMDGWSEWFDLIKGTVTAIEEEMMK
eukprot:CAMPEP_0204638256 /NCGR_PEP_ID=MMETSP0717-20131115/38995_1 /ASSEMBLY_ACC=CAM_ASM_000666 /TAXON_ID=230516 /ORGANISM="Chaetoceros curvisetus" /LENGTH=327 /DNA_ID=CAMNT_0051657971 /DNA_START=79 /DNA_END=1062 /DNA_ORIENTATION=+